MINKLWKHKNIIESFQGAFKGAFIVLRTERNAKNILLAGVAAIVAGLFLELSPNEFIILIIVIIGVFTCEIFNTLVEHILDIVKPQDDPHIKVLKDIASAAVLFACLGAAVIGAIIFLPKLYVLVWNI